MLLNQSKKHFRIIVLLALLLMAKVDVWGQSFLDRSHVGLVFGASKSHSEIENPKTYTSFGLEWNYELTDQLHVRANYFHSKLGSKNDARYDNYMYASSVTPHFSYENSVNEFSLIGEYDFFNLNEYEKVFTPYVLAGLGFVSYNAPYQKVYTVNNGVQSEAKAAYNTIYDVNQSFPRTAPAMPLGLGIKLAVTDRVRVKFETLGHLYFNEDYLDNVKGTDKKKLFRGDYLYSFHLGISFRLGRGGGDMPYNRGMFPPVFSTD